MVTYIFLGTAIGGVGNVHSFYNGVKVIDINECIRLLASMALRR